MNTIFCFALVSLSTALTLVFLSVPVASYPTPTSAKETQERQSFFIDLLSLSEEKNSSQTKGHHHRYSEGFVGNYEFTDYKTIRPSEYKYWLLSEYKDCNIKLSTNQPADYDVALFDLHILGTNFRTDVKKWNSFYESGKAGIDETFWISAPEEKPRMLAILFEDYTTVQPVTIITTKKPISMLSYILPVLGVAGSAAIFTFVRFKRKKVADHTEMEKDADYTE